MPILEDLQWQAQSLRITLNLINPCLQKIGDHQAGQLIPQHRDFISHLFGAFTSISRNLNQLQTSLVQFQPGRFDQFQDPNKIMAKAVFRNWELLCSEALDMINQINERVTNLNPKLHKAQVLLLDDCFNHLKQDLNNDNDYVSNNVKQNILKKKIILHTLKKLNTHIAKHQHDVYICYSWGEGAQTYRVHELAHAIELAGFKVLLDVHDNETGAILPFIQQIPKVNHIVVMGTPNIREKADNVIDAGKSRGKMNENYSGNFVTLELTMIAKRLKDDPNSIVKALLVAEHGKEDDSFPRFLYGIARDETDFRNDALYSTRLFNLLLALSPEACKDEVKKARADVHDKFTQILEPDHFDKLASQLLLDTENIDPTPMHANQLQTNNNSNNNNNSIPNTKKSFPSPFFSSSNSNSSSEQAKLMTMYNNMELSSWTDELQLYIPLQAKLKNEPDSDTFDLYDDVDQFVNDGLHKVLLLTANAGCGKSTFARYFYHQQAKLYTEGKTKTIPLYAYLPTIDDPRENLMQKILATHGFHDPSEIKNLKKSRQFTLILDAYDEITQFEYHELVNLCVSNDLGDWNVNIVLTCRSTYFIQPSDYRKFMKPFVGERPIHKNFREIELCEFDSNQIDTYVNKFCSEQPKIDPKWQQQTDPKWLKPQTYLDFFATIPVLQQLITTPFLLWVSIHILPGVHATIKSDLQENEDLQVNTDQLIEHYVDYAFERQETKIIGNKKHPSYKQLGAIHMQIEFKQFCMDIAETMQQNNLTVITYNPKKRGAFSPFFRTDDKAMNLKREGAATLLVKFNQHQYRFIHPMIQAYFLHEAVNPVDQPTPSSLKC